MRDPFFDWLADFSRPRKYAEFSKFIVWAFRDCTYRVEEVATAGHPTAVQYIARHPRANNRTQPSVEDPPGVTKGWGSNVGFISYPVWLAAAVQGMNEGYVHKDWMEVEMFTRMQEANASRGLPGWRGVLDLTAGGFVVPETFCHLEHNRADNLARQVNGLGPSGKRAPQERWGLIDENLLEYVY